MKSTQFFPIFGLSSVIAVYLLFFRTPGTELQNRLKKYSNQEPISVVNEYIERNNILFPKFWLNDGPISNESIDKFLNRLTVNHTYKLDASKTIGSPCEPGTGLEDERSKFTFVTSLFDIGRGFWKNKEQLRTYADYLQYLTLIMQYDINLVIFIEPKGVNFVKNFRAKCMSRTKIVVSDYGAQEMAKYEDKLDEILHSEKWRKNNQLLNNAEQYANYMTTVNSKPGFLKKALDINFFNSTHFYWIDAGFGHGNKKHFPPGRAWAPSKLLGPELAGKITIVELRDPEFFRNKMDHFYKLDTTAAFAGGFYGGDAKAVSELVALYRKYFLKAIDEGYMDDDQGFHLLAYFEKPQLFYHPKGVWFDLFHRFR